MAKTCGSCERSTPAGGAACRCSVTGRIHECDHPCDVPEKPRLCEVLGVDVGERFTVRDGEKVLGPLCVSETGNLVVPGGFIQMDAVFAVLDAINHPERIERLPHLTPEEVQRCRDFGAEWVSHDVDSNQVWLWEDRPELKPNGVWDGGTSCAQAWDRFFPSVQPGQLVRVEGEP